MFHKLLVGDISARAQLRTVHLNDFVDHTGISLDLRNFELALSHCAIVRAPWNLGFPSPSPKGVGWDSVGINRLLDQIAELKDIQQTKANRQIGHPSSSGMVDYPKGLY